MHKVSLQTFFLTAATIIFFAAQAQAQTLCTGAGIHQSCLNKLGNSYSYNNNYAAHNRSITTTQMNTYNTKVSNRLNQTKQKIGNSYNNATFGTSLNTTKSASNSQISSGINQGLQTFQNGQIPAR